MDTTLRNGQNQKSHPGRRNSLIELYRFLFVLWVVWYHGYFVFKNQYFDDGYLAVEFFFLLSGFYFSKTLDKYNGDRFFVGLVRMIWSKLKPLGAAFIIGVIFVLIQYILEGRPVLFGYLWYIPIMLLAFVMIYTLRYLIKNDAVYIALLIAIVAANFLILYIPISEKLGVARGLGTVSLGVLLRFIPTVEFKVGKIGLNGIITALIFAAVVYLAYLPKEGLACEHLLIFAFMPMLIYFTNMVKMTCKVLDFLGSLSFPIYAYQCILRILRMTCEMPQYCFFIILICLIAADKLIHMLYHRRMGKRVIA